MRYDVYPKIWHDGNVGKWGREDIMWIVEQRIPPLGARIFGGQRTWYDYPDVSML